MREPPRLDLHGIRHEDVQEIVENFVLLHQEEMPLEIIYGNSVTMYNLVKEILDQLGFNHHRGYKNPFGRLLVESYSDPS